MGQGVSLGEASQERYFLQKVKLGEGSFGTVWRAVDRQENTIVAVKQLDKALLPKRGVRRQDIEREIAVMRAVSHPNVTKLFGSWEDSASIFLALEYCNGGDFGDKVREKGMELEEKVAAEWMFQIVAAIWVLHSKNICHRDIKPDNFMVHDEVLKLSDFGLAVHLPFDQKLMEKCGTPAFMSPEQHQLPRSRGYNHSCDVWAAGITMYMVMFAGKHPFLLPSQQLDEQALLAGQLDFSVGNSFFGFAMTDRFSESARKICRQMVMPDMSKRITAAAACHSEWFKEQEVGKFRRPQEGDQIPKEGSPALCKPAQMPAIMREQSDMTVDGGKDKEDAALRWWPFSAEAQPAQPSRPAGTEEQQQERQHEKQELQEELLQHKRALQQGPGPSGAHSDDELRRRIQGLEEQLRRHEEQSRMREEENRLQKEQNESQWEMLVQMQQFIKDKKMTQDLEATMAVKATPSETSAPPAAQAAAGDASPFAQPSSSRSYSRRTVSATAAPPEMRIPAVQTLRPGMRCRYYSNTYCRWINAKVEKYHPNGTFDLDVKQHASIENISPLADVAEAEAWPPGTSVSYNSSSAKRWIDAVVQSFNASGANAGTYNLDVRPCADCDRIRPKLLKHEAVPV